jgi:hypothetical protein
MRFIIVLFILMASQSAHAMDANLMVDIIECESSGRHNAIGDDGTSVGIAQFQKQTFNEMKVKAGMPKLRWKNPIHQMRLMIWMIDNGYGYRWTCYRELKRGSK